MQGYSRRAPGVRASDMLNLWDVCLCIDEMGLARVGFSIRRFILKAA